MGPGYVLVSLFDDYSCPNLRPSDLCRYHYLSLAPRVTKVFVEQEGGLGMVNMIYSLISRWRVCLPSTWSTTSFSVILYDSIRFTSATLTAERTILSRWISSHTNPQYPSFFLKPESLDENVREDYYCSISGLSFLWQFSRPIKPFNASWGPHFEILRASPLAVTSHRQSLFYRRNS